MSENLHFHATAADAVIGHLESDGRRGLSQSQVQLRAAEHGPNVLPEKRSEGWPTRLLRQFSQPLVWILLVAAVGTILLKEWIDCAVILGVVCVNALVGFVQEGRALQAIEALRRTMHSRVTVIRDGQSRSVDSTELVPGDLVLLRAGDRVPADLRLFETRMLQIDESALTGEAEPINKDGASICAPATLLAERSNMAYASTHVCTGTASGLVVTIGPRTEIGRISALVSAAETLATPLTRRMERLSSILLRAILLLAAITSLVNWLAGNTLEELFLKAVALIVAAVPEGLPAAITITLAIGVHRLARANAIIRKLPAVETLGATTVICTDKTGTLTQNEMTVQKIACDDLIYSVTGVGYQPEGGIFDEEGARVGITETPKLMELLRAAVLCNDADLQKLADGTWGIVGSPTEAALVTAAVKGGLDVQSLRGRHPRLACIPFESGHKYMATLHQGDAGNWILVKGAVESVVARALPAAGRNSENPSTRSAGVLQLAENFASEGLRVIAVAGKAVSSRHREIFPEDLKEGLEILGLLCLLDPPRPEALTAMKVAKEAGITVKMITGDHVGTALAIGRQLGLAGIGGAREKVVGGVELAAADTAVFATHAAENAIFGRVTPEQKLRLVQCLQHDGHIVAMTGDGVNDAPALRQANIGIAMGRSGTEVARESSDMILTDDNFASIVAAVREGRGIHDNLVKFITWSLPTNLAEGMVVVTSAFAGLPLPVTPLQILWVNTTTVLLLGIGLAMEPREKGTMHRPPRDPQAPMISRRLWYRMLMTGILLVISTFVVHLLTRTGGGSADQARTAATSMLVFGEMFFLFNCRSLDRSLFTSRFFSNPFLWGGVAAMTCLQLLFTSSAWFRYIFQTEPMSLKSWFLVLGCSSLIALVVEGEKAVARHWTRQRRKMQSES